MPKSTKTPEMEAIDWFRLRLLRQNSLTLKEERDFKQWRLNPQNATAFAKIEGIWRDVDLISTRPDVILLRDAALRKVQSGRRARRIAVAAAAVLAVTASFQTPTIQSFLRNIPIIQAISAWQGDYVSTVIGERSTIALPDGSVLVLNTNSAAEISYSSNERAVRLKRGQALFEVAKGEPRPFVVYAGDRRIIATGTAFDVRVGRDSLEVTLVEGRVIVDPQRAVHEDDRLAQRAVLKAGDRFVSNAIGGLSVSQVNLERATSWTNGRLVFRDVRLADAVAEVNRYSASQVTVMDDRVSDLHINGVFRVGQPIAFAQAVTELYPLQMDRRSNGDIFLIWKGSR